MIYDITPTKDGEPFGLAGWHIYVKRADGTIQASGETDGHHFLALRYIDGEMLENVIERQGPVDEQDAAFVIRQLSEAMQYAWEHHQVIHRDINPANVIITTEGAPVLIDFGLAQIVDQPLTAVLEGLIEGTPNYMSPEQVMTPGDIDFRTDVYALGATMYYLLTGRFPFGEYDEDDVLDLLRNNSLQLTDPRKYVPEISNGCVLLIEHMLARRPFKRHNSWDALIADLQLVEDIALLKQNERETYLYAHDLIDSL